MSKSKARFLSELLGDTGLVKKSKSALAGADEVIDLDVLPSIPNSKLTNSSITINSSATSLGGSVTLTTANVAENTNLYYTDARADARIAAADTGDLSEGSNLYYTDARADARVNLQTGLNLNLSSKNTGDLSEGSNLYYTNARADARIAAATTDDLSEGSSNLYYTDARADARVALIVDSAPGTLNTLNELAAALGDDANFSTTVTNSIATKMPLAGGTFTGNVNITKETPYLNLTDSSASRTLGIFVDDNNSVLRSSGPLLLQINAQSALTIDASRNATFAGTVTGGNGTFTNLNAQLSGNGGLPVSSGTAQTYGSLRVEATSFATILDMGTAGATGAWLQASDKTALGTNYSLLLNPNGGNVGIGTSSIESTLHLQAASAGGRGATLTIDNNATSTVGNESQITFLTDAGASVAGTANARIKAINTNAGDGRADLTFTTWNGSAEGVRLHITSTGNVGIGAGTNPTSKLQVEGSMGTTPLVLMKSLDTTSNDGAVLKLDASGRGSGIVDIDIFGVHNYDGGVFHIRNNGFVGIGTDSPDALLHVSATSPHIDIGPQGGNRAKFGYHSNDVIIGSTSSTGSIILKNNISSTDSPQTSGDTLLTIADGGNATFAGEADFKGGIIRIGTADSSSGHINAYELMTFNIDSDNDDTNRYFGWYKNGESASGTEMMKLDEDNLLSLSGTALVENAKLKAIAASNSDTAVDVFVYDTRKDSDGGAWRKRTQNTSWYNETLNTSTRGARKEFPCVAVIVAETTQLTIYDGDDPDLPMWMVFNSSGVNGAAMLGRSTESTTSISMLNGILSVGRSSFGLHIVHFISDFAEFKEAGYDTPYALPIGTNRNSGNSWVTVNRGNDLVNDTINDVAMTVLPNAPIDADTGLPVPTIAVGTDGGVSVIKDDGTVVDYTGTSQGSDAAVDKISFIGTKRILFSHRYASEVVDLVSSDNSATYYNALSSFRGRITNSISHDDDIHVSALSSDNNIESIALNEEDAASKSVSGLSLANHYQVTSDPDRVSCFITSDYNTGWMNGDIKSATLSDTDTTNVTYANLITNGAFASNITGWSNYIGSVAHDTTGGGRIAVTSNGSYYGGVQTLTAVAGKTYALTFTAVSGTTGARIRAGNASSGTNYLNSAVADGTHTYFFTTDTTTTVRIFLSTSAASGTCYFDNITLSLAERDHTVNSGGDSNTKELKVFGTVTKTAVATGAELVGYSGWSTSNYLQHTSATNYGSPATISFMCWMKTTNISNYQYMGSLIDGTSGNLLGLSINATAVTNAGRPYFYDNVNSSLASSSGPRVDDGAWHCVVGVLDGTSKKIYIDGVLNISSTVTALALTNVTNTNVGFYATSIGAGVQYPHLGSLALWRTSATAPSSEQIAKMYNDEKHLFQDNAKATLYGSSDAVTALAYDDDTELLHVGTSAGRSVFQGLNRVDNTTDAVGAAISASNGFIVEE